MFSSVTDFCDIARVEEDVGAWERLSVPRALDEWGIGRVGVGVGD